MTQLVAEVLPGRGTVSRRGNIGLWLGPDVPERLAIQILQVAREASDDNGGAVVDEISSLLSSVLPSNVGSLAVIAVAGASVKAVLHGPAVVQNGRGEARSGAFTSQVLHFDLPMDGLVGIWGSGGWSEAPPSVSQDFPDGTVPGGGLVIRGEPVGETPPVDAPDNDAEEPPPALVPIDKAEEPSAPQLPASPPADPLVELIAGRPDSTPPRRDSVELVDLTTPPPARAPLPVAGDEPIGPLTDTQPTHSGHTVQGVMCVNGHFNHPDMFYCRVCGIAMIQLTKMLVEGPRPALGVIVVADGSTYTMDEDYVVGREPDPGEGRAIILKDERVSRQHARLSASGWDVVVTDLDSSNGTYVKNPGWHDWVRAVAGHPVTVEPRGQIGLGSQILVYESSVRPSKV